jgi:predicted nucleic acid-binding protein
VFAFTEEAALGYGEIMGDAARQGRRMSAPDGMIAAIARINDGGWRPETSKISKKQDSN